MPVNSHHFTPVAAVGHTCTTVTNLSLCYARISRSVQFGTLSNRVRQLACCELRYAARIR